MISKHGAFLEDSERVAVEKMFLKVLVKFTPKHLCWVLFVNKIAGWKPATSSNRDSGTGAFLWVLRNSWEDLFYKDLGTAASEEQDL